MEAEFGTLLIVLSLVWFIVYWIFGGVIFSIISLVRPGKMKRVRFSCLYTILSALVAYGAAWLGLYWAAAATGTVPEVSSLSEVIVVIGGLGFVGILLGLMVGLVVQFIGGWVIMAISRSREQTWYDKMTSTINEDE